MKVSLIIVTVALITGFLWANTSSLDEKYVSGIISSISNVNNKSTSFEDVKKQCLNDEMKIAGLQDQFIEKMKREMLAGKSQKLNGVLGAIFPNTVNVKYSEIDQISIAKIQTNNLTLNQYLKEFNIDHANIDIVDYVIPDNQNEKTIGIQKVNVMADFNFRGSSAIKKHKRQDRGQMILSFKKEGNHWKLESSEIRNVEHLMSSKKATYIKTNIAALSETPVELRTEAIRRGGYALASADINNDNYTDILIATKSGLHLFMGSKKGYVRLKNAELDSLGYVKTAVFADFDNSGQKDLVLTRLVDYRNQKGHKPGIGVEVFKGNGKGQFSKVTNINQKKKIKVLEPMPAAVADFNNDGLLDFYIGYPGKQDFTTRGEITTGYRPQGVYINKGNFEFDDFTDKFAGFESKTRKLFPHASLAVNFDQKHGTDLLVIDDRGNLSPMFKNNGISFDESAEEIGLGNYGYGMSIAVGDINNSGRTDIAFTNVNFASAKRFQSACSKNYGFELEVPGAREGLRLFKSSKTGMYNEVRTEGLSDTGYGAAGVTFLDYNQDGLQDIYLVNGLWSGEKGSQSLDSLFLAAVDKNNSGLVHSLKSEDYSGFKEFLFKAHGEFDYTTNKWKHGSNSKRPSLAGYQHNRLFRNMGDGSFIEVGYFEGVDSIADGYVVSKVDMNNDGIEDLVLRNSDPGTKEYSYEPVEVFINTQSPSLNQYAIRLQGTRSPRNAYGSFVVAKTNQGQRVRHLIANSGASQDDSVIRFTLKNQEKLIGLNVHWTSGQVDNYKSIPNEVLLIEKKGEQVASK